MRRDDSGPTGTRPLPRIAAAALATGVAAAGVLGFAAPASAHVTITPSTTAAGAHAVLQVAVGHGCGDSATTAVTVRIPPQITSVTPTRTARWEVTKKSETVEPPAVDAHGNQIAERVVSVTYTTGDPLPDGFRDVFELAVQLPEAGGTTLLFPTIQTCEQGESAWIEVPQNGGDVGELELPAPGFTVTGPVPGAGHHLAAAPAGPAPAPAPKAGNLTLAALVAGLAGAVLGGVALFRQHTSA
jgi:uncharacterized protein YcnI